MRWLTALFLTIAVLAVMVGLNWVSGSFLPGLVIVLGSAVWAALDAFELGLHKYKGGTGAVAIFAGVLLLWLLVFPLYLVVRTRRMAGDLALRDEYQNEAAAAARLNEVAWFVREQMEATGCGCSVSPIQLWYQPGLGLQYVGQASLAGSSYDVTAEIRADGIVWQANIR